ASPDELAEIIGTEGPDAEQLVSCAADAIVRLKAEAEQAREERERQEQEEEASAVEIEAGLEPADAGEVVADDDVDEEQTLDAEGSVDDIESKDDETKLPADDAAAD
ncbi:MAG: hypothetical protein GWP07_00175, partial [Xanthomonadaceae bacterium]|nr:hypothetical protein [Xanthomonadaceae bacterium]